MTACKRCCTLIAAKKHEHCWYCQGELCVTCWDTYGHCGEPAAVAINDAARQASPARRKALLAALGAHAPGSLGTGRDVN